MIQRRQDGSVDFDQLWQAYEKGFGSLNGKCSLISLSLTVKPDWTGAGEGYVSSHSVTVFYNRCNREQMLAPKSISSPITLTANRRFSAVGSFLTSSSSALFSRRVLVGSGKDPLHC